MTFHVWKCVSSVHALGDCLAGYGILGWKSFSFQALKVLLRHLLLVEKPNVILLPVLSMSAVRSPPPTSWKFVLGISKFHDDVLALHLFLSIVLGAR